MSSRICLILLASLLVAAAAPAEIRPGPPAMYAKNRDHLWNRLHVALLVRTGPDGNEYGYDRLEPLLWQESDYLLHGKPAEQAVAVLEEFDRVRGERLLDGPLYRAVLQRDLWLVSGWLARTPGSAGKRRLEAALDRVIRRTALTPAEIDALPDTYAAAVASHKYALAFDPERPERAFLPDRLFDATGPWVCIGPPEGPPAPFHLYNGGANPFENSVFLVFLKLPGGREQTLDFLKRLAALKQLLVPNLDGATRRGTPFLPPADFPQWPRGTEVALVRRALLVSTERRVVASRLTESVQVRVVTADPHPKLTEILTRGRAPDPAGRQAAFEFQLRRADLFASKAGGLRDVSGERDFKTGFNSHPWDVFDQYGSGPDKAAFSQRSRPITRRESCAGCHSFPGVYGFNSVPGFAFGSLRPPAPGSIGPRQTPRSRTVAEVEKEVIRWREAQPTWTAFVKRAER